MHLETLRLILRKPQIADVDDYLEFVNSEFVNRYNAMTPATREKAEKQFANAPDDGSVLAVQLKETGKVIGMIYTQDDSVRYEVNSKEISYFIREEQARKGYMKEALSATVSYLFKTENLTCVASRCFAHNIASQRLLEGLGFQQEGLIRKCVKGYQGIVFDDCLYSLMQEDWEKRK